MPEQEPTPDFNEKGIIREYAELIGFATRTFNERTEKLREKIERQRKEIEQGQDPEEIKKQKLASLESERKIAEEANRRNLQREIELALGHFKNQQKEFELEKNAQAIGEEFDQTFNEKKPKADDKTEGDDEKHGV